ncbi:MAG: hypothetical protein ACOY3M_06075 [Patescibacteria group bacterium]
MATTTQYQGAMSIQGKERIGIVHISMNKGRATVTFEAEGIRPQRLGTFSKSQWMDQNEVNVELRGKGLLWRRTVTEETYARRATAV